MSKAMETRKKNKLLKEIFDWQNARGLTGQWNADTVRGEIGIVFDENSVPLTITSEDGETVVEIEEGKTNDRRDGKQMNESSSVFPSSVFRHGNFRDWSLTCSETGHYTLVYTKEGIDDDEAEEE